MTDRIECFWMTPTERARQTLRRYEKHEKHDEASWTCRENRMRFHDTDVRIEDCDYPFGNEGLLGYGRDDVPHDDPRWPTACHVCGYVFREEDHWQHNVQRLFSGAPDGNLYTTRDMPPGAMFDGTWWPRKGPDGIVLMVALPPDGGDDLWMVDGTASNGPGWTREGKPPKVTARPSILTPRYHGWLTDGFLVRC